MTAVLETKMSSPKNDGHNWVGAIRTLHGNPFYLLEPRPADIDIIEIAHPLGMQVRYNGHIPTFYSVAEHCVRVSILLEDQGHSIDVQLGGLLHDGPESYCGDMVRPMKMVPELGEPFAVIEDGIAEAMFDGLGLSELYPLHPAIHDADKAMYLWEVEHIRTGKVTGMGHFEARDVFIDRYNELMREMY